MTNNVITTFYICIVQFLLLLTISIIVILNVLKLKIKKKRLDLYKIKKLQINNKIRNR